MALYSVLCLHDLSGEYTTKMTHSILCCLNRKGKEVMQGPSTMEQAALNGTVRVCYASLEKMEEMEGQPLHVFVWKKVEKTAIWRAWTVALYSSLWEEMIEQKFWSQSSILSWRVEISSAPAEQVYRLAMTAQPRLEARLNQVSTPTQDE